VLKELIIVDDYSTDGTREHLNNLVKCEEGRVKVLIHLQNAGKRAAIRTGIPHVTGDIVLIQDADLECDPQDYQALLNPILDGRADVAFGNRFHGGPIGSCTFGITSVFASSRLSVLC
jgi:glycosyltransferase involved in cell wall biosynthesis